MLLVVRVVRPTVVPFMRCCRSPHQCWSVLPDHGGVLSCAICVVWCGVVWCGVQARGKGEDAVHIEKMARNEEKLRTVRTLAEQLIPHCAHANDGHTLRCLRKASQCQVRRFVTWLHSRLRDECRCDLLSFGDTRANTRTHARTHARRLRGLSTRSGSSC